MNIFLGDPAPLRHLTLPDGGHLAYRDVGSGELVVLLHGGAVDHRMWAHQLAGLGDSHRVLAVDARGHGRSSTPTAPYRHTDDLAHLITSVDAGPATVVGVSMGGSTAVDTALEHPHLVRGVVAVGTGTSEPEFTDPWALAILAQWAAALQAQDPALWLDAFMSFTAGPYRELSAVDPDVVAAVRTMAADTLRWHVRTAPPIAPDPVTDTWSRLGDVDVPVLAVVGTLDAADHERLAARLASEAPQGRLVKITDAAHYPPMERPAEFTAILRDALERTG